MNEKDPNGKDPHQSGAKLDAGKPRPALVIHGFARALTDVSKVATFGADKYSENGWRTVPDGKRRYLNAMYRHLLKSAREPLDPDSKLPHLAHAAWNALAILELELATQENVNTLQGEEPKQ